MGAFEKYISLRNSWPGRAVGKIVVDSTRPVWRRVIGASLTTAEVRMRQTEMPVAKAEIGAVAVREGLKAGDPELLDIGRAMVTQALADTQGKPLQATVTEVAASLDIDDVTQTSLVSPDTASKAAQAMYVEENFPPL